MKAVFMGTPDIAAIVLKTVLESKKHEILAVVTQPDKPKGRGHEMAFPPVKEVALEHNIPVLQPEKMKDPDFFSQLTQLKPDIILVVAYGRKLPLPILELPRFGCINVHASLLPKYRGAAPIQWAVINGETVSGVTIMHMAEGIDTGDMILTQKVELSKDETAGTLHDKLAAIGGPLLLSAMDAIETGRAPRIRQKEEDATYVTILEKTTGNMNFRQPADQLERLIRGLNPWPTAYTKLDGKMLKIWKADVLDNDQLTKEERKELPGTVIRVEKDEIGVMTGDGILMIRELQMEGKRRMTVEEFLRGYHLDKGILLGM